MSNSAKCSCCSIPCDKTKWWPDFVHLQTWLYGKEQHHHLHLLSTEEIKWYKFRMTWVWAHEDTTFIFRLSYSFKLLHLNFMNKWIWPGFMAKHMWPISLHASIKKINLNPYFYLKIHHPWQLFIAWNT